MPIALTMTVSQIAAMCVEHMPDDKWDVNEWYASYRENGPSPVVTKERGSMLTFEGFPSSFIPRKRMCEMESVYIKRFEDWWCAWRTPHAALDALWEIAKDVPGWDWWEPSEVGTAAPVS